MFFILVGAILVIRDLLKHEEEVTYFATRNLESHKVIFKVGDEKRLITVWE